MEAQNELHLGGTHSELHLGGGTAKIFQLGIQTEQSRLAYPKRTRFENRKIGLKIDPKQAKNGPNCFFQTMSW